MPVWPTDEHVDRVTSHLAQTLGELAGPGDPAIVRACSCGARSLARMRRLVMAEMPLQSIQADEPVPAVISG